MPETRVFRVTDLSPNRPTAFDLRPDAGEMTALAGTLGLAGLRKLRFQGELRAEGRRDWHLSGRLGATVVQPCVVTLEPVTTRIDVTVERRYLAQMPAPESDEVEMPEDDTAEPLPAAIDLEQVMAEALALNLPLYPRAPDADLGQAVFTEPGRAAMTDEASRPFAGLAVLKGGRAPEDD